MFVLWNLLNAKIVWLPVNNHTQVHIKINKKGLEFRV